MKIINVVVFAVILLFSISAIGQINPDDRFGTLLNFESGDSSVVSNGDTISLTVFQFVDIYEKAANPDPNEINSSDNVAKITTNDGTLPFVFVDNEYILDFSVRNQIQIDVYSPAVGKSVQFVIEKFNDFNINIPLVATTTVANEWETLTFDFSGAEPDTYGRIVIYMDFGGTDVGDVWYFDNVVKNRPPITYDDGILADFDEYNPYWFNWGGSEFDIIDNPDDSGINTSERVGAFITSDLTWDGAVVVEGYEKFDFSEGALFKIKVYAPDDGRSFLFQLEHFDDSTLPDGRVFVIATTNSFLEWEELSFDFGNMGLESDFYSKIVVMPDFNGVVVGEEWLFDDIVFEGKATSVISPTPIEYKLYTKNYPNPFNPGTTINYSIPTNSMVQLVVYNILGKEVAILVNEDKLAGSYTVNFNGSELSSGVYFYTLTTGTEVISNKMLLIK